MPVEQAPPLSFVLLKAPLSDPRLRRFRPEFPLLPNLHDLGWEPPGSTTPFVCPDTVGVTAGASTPDDQIRVVIEYLETL